MQIKTNFLFLTTMVSCLAFSTVFGWDLEIHNGTQCKIWLGVHYFWCPNEDHITIEPGATSTVDAKGCLVNKIEGVGVLTQWQHGQGRVLTDIRIPVQTWDVAAGHRDFRVELKGGYIAADGKQVPITVHSNYESRKSQSRPLTKGEKALILFGSL